MLADNAQRSIRANGQAMSTDTNVGINIGAFVDPANGYGKMVDLITHACLLLCGKVNLFPIGEFFIRPRYASATARRAPIVSAAS